jgi:putative transposase
VSIQNERTVLWRAVEQDGDVLDVLLQKRKDTPAAKPFFSKLLMGQRQLPIDITTDQLPSQRTRAAAAFGLRPHAAAG